MTKTLPLVLLAILAGIPAAWAEREPHRVPRVDAAVRLDGVLDDELWGEALVLEPSYETSPGENVPAPVRTEAFLAYDDDHLYVAFRAYDPEPRRIVANLTDRDKIDSDDRVMVKLDTFNDQRRFYVFAANPLGVQADFIESQTGGGGGWDGIWKSAGRVTEGGYEVEMAIPFHCLGFQRREGDQVWGVDLSRSYPRDVNHQISLFPVDRDNTCVMCQAEKLIGFDGATPGRNLEVDPTFSSVATERREGDGFTGADPSSDLGLTLRWGFTPNMTVSATLHPDFSQVEADAAQLEVNQRFALYYPEKRPFFLEGADFFTTRISAIHTRALADPAWGVKLSGKEGPHSLGVFVVEDEVTNLIFPGPQSSSRGFLDQSNTSSAVRYRRDLGKRDSTVGAVLTHRESGGYRSSLAGFDADWRITKEDRFRVQVLGSETQYPPEVAAAYGQDDGHVDGSAFELFYNHSSRDYTWIALLSGFEPGFRADLGFVPQTGYRQTYLIGQRTFYGDAERWFTKIRLRGNYLYREGYGDGPALQDEAFVSLAYEGPLRSETGFTYVVDGEMNFREPPAGSGYFPVKTTDLVDSWLSFWPASSLHLSLYFTRGGDIDVEHVRPAVFTYFEADASFQPSRRLSFTAKHTLYDLDVDPWTVKILPSGPVDMDGGRLLSGKISELRTVFQFSRRSFLRAILQHVDYRYNPELYAFPVEERFRHLFTQLLFSYKFNPQTVIFAGYSDNRLGDPSGTLQQTDRTFFLKLGYAWVL